MSDELPTPDTVRIRTSSGVIQADVTQLIDCERPPNRDRMGGDGVDGTGETVLYVDYIHGGQ